MPRDPHAVILRWESRGGMAPGGNELDEGQTALRVHANGRYSARPEPGGLTRKTGHLDPKALQALLSLVISEHRFETITRAAILARIEDISRRTGRLFRVMDGGETLIELTLPDHRHGVTFPALHAAHQAFPDIEPLQRLFAIQQALLTLAGTARTGA